MGSSTTQPSAALVLTQLRAGVTRLQQVKSGVIQQAVTSLDTRLAAIETDAARSGGTVTDLEALATLETALPAAAAGIELAIVAFESGDVLGGVQGVMDTCASIAPVIGAIIGGAVGNLPGAAVGAIVGGFIGSFFSLISLVLGFVAPKTESVAETVRHILEEMDVDRVQADIRSVHRSFLHYATALNDECASIVDPNTNKESTYFQPAVAAQVIQKLNLVDGVSTSTFWKVIDWLENPKHQNQREWLIILDAACNAYSALLMAIVRITSLMNSDLLTNKYRKAKDANNTREMNDLHDLWVAATTQLVLFGSSQRMDLKQLRRLTARVQNHGTLWRIDPGLQAGVIDPKVTPTGFGGNSRKMSVTVCSKDQASPQPTYHVYLTSWSKTLDHWRVNSYASSEPRMADNRLPGADSVSGGPIEDVFAIPGTDLNLENHAIVYELSDAGKKIEGKYRDVNGKEIGKAFFTQTIAADAAFDVNTVRAVHNPYTYGDDPAGGFLKDVKYIVYGGGSGLTMVHPSNAQRVTGLVSPFGRDIRGIAVDQDYLWIFSEKQFACATHASVVKAISTNQATNAPSWIKCDIIPASGALAYFYPSDDGTLVAAVKNSDVLYTTAYNVQLEQKDKSGKVTKAGKITAYASDEPLTWTALQGRKVEGGVEKLPAFSWAQFESLRETLETLEPLFHKRSASNTARGATA